MTLITKSIKCVASWMQEMFTAIMFVNRQVQICCQLSLFTIIVSFTLSGKGAAGVRANGCRLHSEITYILF